MKSRRRIIAAGVFTIGAAAAFAQDGEVAQQKAMAQRAAQADAYRKLAETIKGLHLTSDTLVRDFVAESDTIKSDLDAFVIGVKVGEAHWQADGTCEVTAEVSVQRVIEELKQTYAQHYRGNALRAEDFESIGRSYQRESISVIGVGAPGMTLPPGATGGSIQVAVSPPGGAPAPALPPVWTKLPPQARLMAERAAEVDAQRKLLERIVGLRVSSNTQVRDFAVDWDSIRTSAQGMLVGAEKKGAFYHFDEPIVEVTYALPAEQVLATIKALAAQQPGGASVSDSNLRSVREDIRGGAFEATGVGVPPPRFAAAMREAAGEPLPDWATEPLTATGQGTDAAMDTPQGKLKAARAAELDARRKLSERVYGLRLTATTTVKDFGLQHDEVRAQIDALLGDVSVINTEWKSNLAEVTVSMPGMQLWDLLNNPAGEVTGEARIGAPPVPQGSPDDEHDAQ